MKNEIVVFEDQDVKLEVNMKDETVWLSQQQMAELFDSSRTNIIEHINNIYSDGELDKISTCQDFRQVRKEGKRDVARNIPFYNLDMIISVGYRVNTKRGIQFRQWATKILKDYLLKGGAVNHNYQIQRQIDDRFIALQENTDKRFLLLEQKVEHQQEQIDLYIKTNEEPKELLFGNGCQGLWQRLGCRDQDGDEQGRHPCDGGAR